MQRNAPKVPLNSNSIDSSVSNIRYQRNNESNKKNSNLECHTERVFPKSSPSASAKYIRYRVSGYSVGAAVHLANILAMALALRGPVMKEPDVALFYSMEFFYITIWNLVFQVTYVGIGLACDLPVMLKLKDSNILNSLRNFRETYYHGLLWPYAMFIFCVYWPLYIYDRNLIFPDYIDKVLSQVSNYIMHMFIVYPIIWDLFFLPTRKRASSKYTLFFCLATCIIYNTAMFALHAQRGVWPYPLLKLIYGTVYFPIFFVVAINIQLTSRPYFPEGVS